MQKIRQEKGGTVGANVRRLRIMSGLTQEEVAAEMRKLGCTVSRSIYAQIECGVYNIRACELAALKETFKAEWEDFFRGVKPPAEE